MSKSNEKPEDRDDIIAELYAKVPLTKDGYPIVAGMSVWGVMCFMSLRRVERKNVKSVEERWIYLGETLTMGTMANIEDGRVNVFFDKAACESSELEYQNDPHHIR